MRFSFGRLIKVFLWLLGAGVLFVLGMYFSMNLILGSSKTLKAPDLVGRDIVDALKIASEKGLNLRVSGSVPSDTYPKNTVVSQRPLPGTEMKRRMPVAVRLSSGPVSVMVPDLRGMELGAALYALESDDFLKGKIVRTCDDSVCRGCVVAQSPPPFSRVGRHGAVDLVVSDGSCGGVVVMPDLTSMSQDEAVAFLAGSGLGIYKIVYSASVGEDPSTVVGQRPEPGNWVSPDDEVVLVVVPPKGGAPVELSFYMIRIPLSFGFLKRKVEFRVQRPGGLGYVRTFFAVPRGGADVVFSYEPGTVWRALVNGVQVSAGRTLLPGFFSADKWRILFEYME